MIYELFTYVGCMCLVVVVKGLVVGIGIRFMYFGSSRLEKFLFFV